MLAITGAHVSDAVRRAPASEMGLTPVRVASSKAQKHQGPLRLTEQLQQLTLQEMPDDVPLARIQRLFSFRASGAGAFPQPEKQHFQELLVLLPKGMG